jgi:hypothetical protein
MTAHGELCGCYFQHNSNKPDLWLTFRRSSMLYDDAYFRSRKESKITHFCFVSVFLFLVPALG